MLFCFFNDTAPTEFYTYLHTLSLHDALPICTIRIGGTSRASLPMLVIDPLAPKYSVPLGSWRRSCWSAGKSSCKSGWPSRSEEHTSELQSLMRISYAVFCLKKKKQQNKD